MENKKEIIVLLERYINRDATEEERLRFFAAIEEDMDSTEWEQTIKEFIEQQPANREYDAKHWEPIIANILSYDHETAIDSSNTLKNKSIKNKPRKQVMLFRIGIAATIALLLGGGLWFGLYKNSDKQMPVATSLTEQQQDILPGGNKAVLTLANGKKIILDSSNSGLLSMQGGTKVVKVNNGLLTYQAKSQNLPAEVATQAGPKEKRRITFNTITTPRGGQYKVVLPDGSRVWLNAASSIRFPTAFTGKERRVEMTGEAYFEITSNSSKPFTVYFSSPLGGGREGAVKVLGTEFNIMAYEKESAIKTTLLTGKVRVEMKSEEKGEPQSIIMNPGQQVRWEKETNVTVVEQVNIAESVAWKNGLFQFSDADIATIMRQLSRWYKINVVYEGAIPDGAITGKIPRDTKLSNVLKIMELSGLQFKIKGRKVIVLAN